MPFMSHPEHGYHQATEAEVPEMVKNGWKLDVHPHDPINKPPLAIEENNATIQVQPEPKRQVGRPRKADSGVVI
jgi:hypothetical protein